MKQKTKKEALKISIAVGLTFASFSLFVLRIFPNRIFLLVYPYFIIIASILMGLYIHDKLTKIHKPIIKYFKTYIVKIETKEGKIIKGVLSKISQPFVFLEKVVIEHEYKLTAEEEYVVLFDDIKKMEIEE